MADIPRVFSASPIPKGGRDEEHGYAHNRRGRASADRDGGRGGGGHAHEDVAFVLGLPAEAVSAPVAEAIGKVMDDYGAVRKELELARERETYLRDLSERHPTLPVLNRRGLVREMGVVINRAAQSGTVNTFACLLLLNGPMLHISQGGAVRNAVLAAVAERFATGLRASDVVASLDGYDLALVLTLSDQEAATRKIDALLGHLDAEPPCVEGRAMTLRFAYGLHGFEPGEAIDDIIAAADFDLRQRVMAAMKRS